MADDNRVLFGSNEATGDYGVFVSKVGANVLSPADMQNPGNYAFNSSESDTLGVLKVIQTGTFQVTCKKTLFGKRGPLEVSPDEAMRANADYVARYPWDLETVSPQEYLDYILNDLPKGVDSDPTVPGGFAKMPGYLVDNSDESVLEVAKSLEIGSANGEPLGVYGYGSNLSGDEHDQELQEINDLHIGNLSRSPNEPPATEWLELGGGYNAHLKNKYESDVRSFAIIRDQTGSAFGTERYDSKNAGIPYNGFHYNDTGQYIADQETSFFLNGVMPARAIKATGPKAPGVISQLVPDHSEIDPEKSPRLIHPKYIANVYCDFGRTTIEFSPALPEKLKTPHLSVFFAVANSSGHFHPWYANVHCDNSDYNWQYANSQHCVHMDSAWFRGKWSFRERTMKPLGGSGWNFPMSHYNFPSDSEATNIEIGAGIGNVKVNGSVNNTPHSVWGGMFKCFAGLQGVIYQANNTHLTVDGFMTPTHCPTPFKTNIDRTRILSGGEKQERLPRKFRTTYLDGYETEYDWVPCGHLEGGYDSSTGETTGKWQKMIEFPQGNLRGQVMTETYQDDLFEDIHPQDTRYWMRNWKTRYGRHNSQIRLDAVGLHEGQGGLPSPDLQYTEFCTSPVHGPQLVLHNLLGRKQDREGLPKSTTGGKWGGGFPGSAGTIDWDNITEAEKEYEIAFMDKHESGHAVVHSKGTRFPTGLPLTTKKTFDGPPGLSVDIINPNNDEACSNHQYDPGDVFAETRTFQGQPTSLDSFWNSFSNNMSQWVSANTPYGEFQYADGGYAMDITRSDQNYKDGNPTANGIGTTMSLAKHNWHGGNIKAAAGTEGRRFGFGGAGSEDSTGPGGFDTYIGTYVIYDISGGDSDG